VSFKHRFERVHGIGNNSGKLPAKCWRALRVFAQCKPTLEKCLPSAGEHHESVTIDKNARQVLERDQEITILLPSETAN